MKPSDFQKTVQCRFESCLKKVVRHIVKDYQQGLKRRKDKEIPFCELPEIFVENFAVWDDYETDYTIFSVCGIDIRVLDDELAEALKKLPERKRNTLLMYYFLEMTESEIANLQKITQSGVFKNRHHALETMKKILTAFVLGIMLITTGGLASAESAQTGIRVIGEANIEKRPLTKQPFNLSLKQLEKHQNLPKQRIQKFHRKSTKN